MPVSITVSFPKRRPRPDLRSIGLAVASLQIAEGMALHAVRDQCLVHAVEALMVRKQCLPTIPTRLLSDREWVHQHIEAPGVRIQARNEDEWSKA